VPDGVVSVQIDSDTGELATSSCPHIVTEYYLVGTQPAQFCHLHNTSGTQFANWQPNPAVPGAAGSAVPPYNPQAPATPNPAGQPAPVPGAPTQSPNANAPNNPQPDQQQPQKEKKKGLLDKLKGIFH
jgi:penicillin-binding protein 1B